MYVVKENMKSGHSSSDVPKPTQNKNIKKSTSKSKSKTTSTSSAKSTTTSMNTIVTTPTTPTTTTNNVFDATFSGGGNSSETGKSTHKNYIGLEPRSIKTIWEQHDQTDEELSQDVCARLAEDATYKLWEVLNSIKTYSRHSGGIVTYDLVNEVFKDADVPPALGAMDSDWDRINQYDGSYFFYSDKILELRDEYQKEVNITIPEAPDFICTAPVEDKHADQLKQFVPSLIYACLHGDAESVETALKEATTTPLLGACYRSLVTKIIQILAFKQVDSTSRRCWRLLRACNINLSTRNIQCREEYFHLAEILVSQLLAPYESIKVHDNKIDVDSTIKMEVDVGDGDAKEEQTVDIKEEQFISRDSQSQQQKRHQMETGEFCVPNAANVETVVLTPGEKVYKLKLVDNEDKVEAPDQQQMSPYFASPVAAENVDELCETIGQLAAQNGYLHGECLFLIKRRLTRFFEGRFVSTERDFSYISRAVRVLIALGEYAFREFIPFIYNMSIDAIPESLWHDFKLAGAFINGPDDVYLYEWLAYGCGNDKLQPFMLNYAHYNNKLLTKRLVQNKLSIFKIHPKFGVRRLEWSTLAAAMCHGDDPNKAPEPKPTIHKLFPELVMPNLSLNRAGTIRFKFAGCRPVILKPKGANKSSDRNSTTGNGKKPLVLHSDILIAKRKLLKPLTNFRQRVPLSSYHFSRI